GLSAAIGKTGAAIGTQVFRPIQDNLGKKWTFIIAAIVGLVGVVIAYIFVPDTTQLDFEAEDEAWRAYLLSQGWNHEMGDGSGPEHLASEVVVVPRAGAGDLRGTGTAREEDEEEKQQ
ncbi:Plasma membrane permease, mediates uptake of glycerophosphoinositol and glycerophosphocholine, partial [Tilletia horrida]